MINGFLETFGLKKISFNKKMLVQVVPYKSFGTPKFIRLKTEHDETNN